MVGDVARHTQEKTFPQEHQLPVERSGREIAKWSQHVALAAGVQTWHHNMDTDHDDNLEHAMKAHSFGFQPNPCAVTHTSSHILASTQALRKEIISDRTTWKIICVLGARLAHHTAHELVGEQKLNFFLCVVILNYFFEQN